jgi:outer membrane lipoprotein-sorting protein
MRGKVLLTVMALFVGFGASAQSLNAEFERELKAKSQGITSIVAEMTQTREVAVLADVVKKEGDFRFNEPCNILLSFDDGDYIELTAEWFVMKSGTNVTKRSASSNPMLKQLSTMLTACMSGDVESIAKGFTPTITKSDKEWRVVLKPERGKGAAKIAEMELIFNRKDMSLDSLKMVEKSDDYTMYTFRNKQFNMTK